MFGVYPGVAAQHTAHYVPLVMAPMAGLGVPTASLEELVLAVVQDLDRQSIAEASVSHRTVSPLVAVEVRI